MPDESENETHSKLHQYRSRRSGRSGGIVQGLADRIRGIGTDVHAGRYADPSHPVYQHPNFYALPHVAGTTLGTTIRRAEAALENVNRIAGGLEPMWRVDNL